MATTTFVDETTVIEAEWCNEVDALVHDILSAPTSVAEVKTALSLTPGTDIQAFDATLTSIAALGTAADKFAYTTGVDTWAEGDITAAGRALLDDADAATQRATLGLVIGTNVQAYDATILNSSDIGVSVQAYDATYLVDADIGSTVEAYVGFTDPILDKAAPGNIGATTPGTGKFSTLESVDDLTVDADASGSGSVIGGATGGAQGAGTVNAKGLYVDGVSVGTTGITTKYKTADESVTSSTTLQDDDHLINWTLAANSYYKIEGILFVTGPSAAEFRCAFNRDNAEQSSRILYAAFDDAVGTKWSVAVTAFNGGASPIPVTLANVTAVYISGYINTHATLSTDADFQWAQGTSDATATVLRDGSWITFTKIS